jgi:SEC-C motif-containing protein
MPETTQSNCPCGREQPYSACCQPIIKGKRRAETAEDLLRARYAAFTQGEVDYILKTHHSKTASEVKREEIEDWSKNSKWIGLQVVQKEAGEAKDEQGTIVFCAMYEADGKKNEHWEQSFFEKEGGEWRFLDARGIQTGTYRRPEPKVGRNDPCACGSGKKSKKCCAA